MNKKEDKKTFSPAKAILKLVKLDQKNAIARVRHMHDLLGL
jgi:hypothetical protein